MLPVMVGDSVVSTYSVPMNSTWNSGRVYALAILQEEMSKDVVQSAASLPKGSSGPVGMAEMEQKKVLIYPNPANDFVVFDTDETVQSAGIYNMLGKVEKNIGTISSGKNVIDVSGLKRGIYFHRSHQSRRKICLQSSVELDYLSIPLIILSLPFRSFFGLTSKPWDSSNSFTSFPFCSLISKNSRPPFLSFSDGKQCNGFVENQCIGVVYKKRFVWFIFYDILMKHCFF